MNVSQSTMNSSGQRGYPGVALRTAVFEHAVIGPYRAFVAERVGYDRVAA